MLYQRRTWFLTVVYSTNRIQMTHDWLFFCGRVCEINSPFESMTGYGPTKFERGMSTWMVSFYL